jgi:hypothetical protein
VTRTDLPLYLAFCIAVAVAMVFYARWGWKKAVYSDDIVSKEQGKLAMNSAMPVGLVCVGCAVFTVYRMAKGF